MASRGGSSKRTTSRKEATTLYVLTRAGAKEVGEASLVEFHHSHAKEKTTRIETADPQVMRAFCELHEADYACFPAYALPKAYFD